MTVMPGFIDAHRHIINGNDQQWFKDQGPENGAPAIPPENSSRLA